MKKFQIFSLFFFLFLRFSFAEEPTRERVTATPFLLSFTQGRIDLQRDTIIYRQEKLIFGMDVKLNERLTGRVAVDLIRMNQPYLRNTSLTWRKESWTIDAGIFFTSEMDMSISRFWSNRFIDRVPADRWLNSPTADLGARVAYRWNDFITTDISLGSGNGYQRLMEK